MRVMKAVCERSGVQLRRRGLVLVLALLTVAIAATASGQVLYGTITGEVTDPTGADIPNATLTVTNEANGATRSTTTGANGEYTVPNLEPGPYTVSVAGMGSFGGYAQKNVAVGVNIIVRVNVTLQPGSVKTEVEVNTSAPILQTETAEVNHQITSTQIAELPVTSTQGRNYQALYTLIPGSTNVAEQNSTASNPSRAMSLNVNGIESMSNTTRIDGAVNTYGWLPYLIAYVPPADSIQTVNITTNSFNAEQGVAGGASINVIIKSGTNSLHGSLWYYNQLFNTNARPYTSAPPPAQIPKNIFNEFGFTVGGPVYIPKVFNGKNKLFFFQGFERTTRRQLITGTVTVPDALMLSGNFSEVASLTTAAASALLYDPQPGGVPATGPNAVNGYLLPAARTTTFLSEYGCNCIPASRQSYAATQMLPLLAPLSKAVGTPTATQLNNQLAADYLGSGTLGYNRNTSDSKITWNISDRTNLFGRYSIEPFSVTDPQQLGAAGGGTFDGGQPGAASGRIQNVGLGFSHVLSPSLVIDADGGYTRQVTGAQSTVDIAAGDFGLNVLKIPGTNGIGPNYVGQPIFQFVGFNALGNANTANPFLFRDNQFTGDVNLSWTKGKHATKYGFTYYHFLLNHFQPTSGSGVINPRGGFVFQGGMTSGGNGTAALPTTGLNAYSSLADFILGLPNNNSLNGNNNAIAKAVQATNPNALRWTEIAVYAQDQWTMTPKLTLNYGARYEYYPPPYKDHTGVYRLDPSLPQSGNVEVGGVGGNPKNAGINAGWGMIFPRLGVAYRATDKLVLRAGAGLTEDPDSMRFLRDSYPTDLTPLYAGPASNTVAVDPTTGNVLTLAVGIPPTVAPDISSGFVSLPVSGGTNTIPANYRRGYIESWNAFVQQDLGGNFVMNLGYVGTHQVRQLVGYTLNAGPLPSGSTICMANGQYNPSTPYYTHALGQNPCNFQANTIINMQHCATASSAICYNTGGIGMNQPLFSAEYNGLQGQLSHNAGRLAQFGLVYTWSHAIDFEDDGAGSGSAGTAFSYPAYFAMNRATAAYDRTNNLQFWWIYRLPFGSNQKWANSGWTSAVFGGLQLNGQISHFSGAPFSVTPSTSAINSPGNTEYAQLVKPYHQLGGHNRTPGNSSVSGGNPWFDPTSFANPVQPTYSPTQLPSQIAPPVFGNTSRNEFRGPGVTLVNASIFRGFHIYRESEFQIRVEAFNLLNHPQLSAVSVQGAATINSAVGGGTFGYITSFGATRSLQFSGRFNF